ncbi:hypothetical protein PFISCL1PPCAC_2486, partial [Pristionchus fissidentatus]
QQKSFRGGGRGQESSEPLINSSLVYNSIFAKDSFPRTFASFSGTEPEFEQQINQFDFSRSKAEFMKIPLTVKDLARPVSIDNTPLYYFWGNLSLPSETTNGCYNFTTTNDNKYVSLCNVTEMERCAANISDLPHFTPFKFLSSSGHSITQFAWLCPVGQTCCVWECCDTFPWKTVIIVILSIIGIPLICLCVL